MSNFTSQETFSCLTAHRILYVTKSWRSTPTSSIVKNVLALVGAASGAGWKRSSNLTGAKCGATTIDRQFIKWMEKKFGTAYTSLSIKKRGPGSAFMQAFESQKRNFGDRDDDRDTYEIGPIAMNLDVESIKYDEDDNVVKVSR